MLIITTPFGTGKDMVLSRAYIMCQLVSTNVGQPNFKFCVRFYPTGSPGGGTIFIPFVTIGNYLNVSELIDGQISYERALFETTTTGQFPSLSSPQSVPSGRLSYLNTQCVQQWTLEIKEGYDVAGVFTIDDGSVVTYPVYYVKGYKTAQQGGDNLTNQTIYPIPTASVSQGWLTQSTYSNRPWIGQRIYANAARAICIPTFASHRCSFAHINDDGTLLAGCIATKYRYNLYNGGSILATQDYTYTTDYPANSTSPRNKLLYAGIGLWNIENTDVAIIPANEKPSNFPTWTHYTIQLLSNSAQASQVIAMYNYECYTKPFTLRWTNDVGGVEHYTFDGGNMVTDEIERVQTYSQGYAPQGAIFHRLLGERTAMSSVTQSIELKTGMLTVEERKFLATIYRSESLELQSPTGITWPVTMSEKSTTYRVRDNFELDTFSVKLKFSSDGGSII